MKRRTFLKGTLMLLASTMVPFKLFADEGDRKYFKEQIANRQLDTMMLYYMVRDVHANKLTVERMCYEYPGRIKMPNDFRFDRMTGAFPIFMKG